MNSLTTLCLTLIQFPSSFRLFFSEDSSRSRTKAENFKVSRKRVEFQLWHESERETHVDDSFDIWGIPTNSLTRVSTTSIGGGALVWALKCQVMLNKSDDENLNNFYSSTWTLIHLTLNVSNFHRWSSKFYSFFFYTRAHTIKTSFFTSISLEQQRQQLCEEKKCNLSRENRSFFQRESTMWFFLVTSRARKSQQAQTLIPKSENVKYRYRERARADLRLERDIIFFTPQSRVHSQQQRQHKSRRRLINFVCV